MAMLRPLAEWNPHGIIAHLDDAKVARAILRLGRPVVDTACMLKGLGVPTVDVDHTAVARLAADHFLTRGYRNFGYFGSRLAHYSQVRLAGFRAAVERAGFEVHSCHVEYLPRLSDRASWKSANAQVRQWLRELAKPVAVLADHDVAAHDLADMCQLLGLRVPDDVAILGVDNDELECQLAFPPLSSVVIPAERIGFEAAKRLDRMLSGRRVSDDVVYLPSVHIVTRHSTSMFAVDEPIVTAALHYIRNHLTEPLNVGRIAAEVVVRRRVLETEVPRAAGALRSRRNPPRTHRTRQRTAGEHRAADVGGGPALGLLEPAANGDRLSQAHGRSPGEYRREARRRVAK